jgi:heme exporter protein A
MMSSASPALFRAENLACRRGERLVFQDLHFSLPAGGALLLLGPNGSGKSSLLRLLAGLLKPEAGSLFWGDQSLSEDREAHAGRLHYLGHQDSLKNVLTVRENLAFWARLHDPEAGEAQIDAALAAFALAPLAELPAKLLSAGQRRRLALSRLLAAEAPLWLLDEPSVGLDHASVARLERMIAEHRAAGGIVLLSTHVDLGVEDAGRLHLDHFAPKARAAQEVWA